MRILTRAEYLACQRGRPYAPDVTPEMLDQRRFQGQAALAFGMDRPPKPNEYTDLDLVAAFCADQFAGHFGRKIAAQVTRFFWPNWTDSLRRAEAEQRYGALFVVGKRDMLGRKSPLLFVDSGTHEEIQEDWAKLPDHERPPTAFSVDMWAASLAIREDAKRAGVELSDPLFIPHDNPDSDRVIKLGMELVSEKMSRWSPQPPPRLPAKVQKLVDSAFRVAREQREKTVH